MVERLIMLVIFLSLRSREFGMSRESSFAIVEDMDDSIMNRRESA